MPGVRNPPVRLTRPDHVVFPEGITKRDVADYYRLVAPHMLPFLRDRPLVMQRYPEGIDKPGFYQKNASDYFPGWVRQVRVKKEGGSVNHVVCDDEDTLLYLVNQGCLTFHTWLSRVDALDNPDLLVFDLDPQRDGDFDAVRRGALQLRGLLYDLGLESFAQTTGSRGLHVDVPLDGSRDFDAVRGFARDVAETLVRREPQRFTTQQRKARRGGRIFVDTLRNAYAQTAVAPYSLRARPGAPAATPLRWDEVEDEELRPDAFGLVNMQARLRDGADPWRELGRRPHSLDAAAEKLRSVK